MEDLLDIRPEVAAALNDGGAVVALESSLIAQGLPFPHNLETARRSEALVRAAGAVPATIGIAGGRIRVGLEAAEIERFAETAGIAKASRRDLAALVAQGADGATTVAGTLVAAHLAGIRVMATGGIGGVHRGGQNSLDVSADLTELGRTPVAVISAGAKAILDLPRTLEVLETQGVPVVGYRTNEFPAFYCRTSGLQVDARAETPEALARLVHTQWTLGLDGGLLIVQPPPARTALAPAEVDGLIARALEEAETAKFGGKNLTPYLLGRIAALSGGRALEANAALIEANASLAGKIAVRLATLS